MDFDKAIKIINALLARKKPISFSSSWILKHTPDCYRFIQRSVRTEFGTIDWDKVTYALERRFQRKWIPRKSRKNAKPYRDYKEVKLVLKKYRNKLYVFLSPQDVDDRRIRDIVAITLVRLSQKGNLSAKRELLKLITYTVNDWLEKYSFLNRWQGYDEKIQKQLDGCIRRYRYTGSFISYVFRTLELAGRGIPAFYAYSLDEPVAYGSHRSKKDNVVQYPDTGEIEIYDRLKMLKEY